LENQYEAIIGLEVHVQLKLATKAFAPEAISFGQQPNTQISAVLLGIALGSRINRTFHFDRKNYFYADLPKGYQITQDGNPVCTGGNLEIWLNRDLRKIRINRVHMEEDAGKSIHDINPDYSFLDFNRAGTALLEIVSEPDLRSPEEVHAYISSLQQLVQYLDISNADMEKGELRCDCNISIRKKGDKQLGERCEIKNINSRKFAKKACAAEIKRQLTLIKAGHRIERQTLRYKVSEDITVPIRDKESAKDYRYFPDPDLPLFSISDEVIDRLKNFLPVLPNEMVGILNEKFSLSIEEARQLAKNRQTAELILDLHEINQNKRLIYTFFVNKMLPWIQEHKRPFPLTKERLGQFLDLINSKQVGQTAAWQKLLPACIENPTAVPLELASNLGIIRQSDAGILEKLIDEAIRKYPEKYQELKSGKKNLMGLFIGAVMRTSEGKADPQKTRQILLKRLEDKK
jgi:aspartyl-tRNA(Asn)/glutamyl-tRNA(Gln) amidotransferase subunit B